MSDVHVWLSRENKVVRLVVDGEEINRNVRFKVVFNFWNRDSITIHQGSGYITNLVGLFQIVITTKKG